MSNEPKEKKWDAGVRLHRNSRGALCMNDSGILGGLKQRLCADVVACAIEGQLREWRNVLYGSCNEWLPVVD